MRRGLAFAPFALLLWGATLLSSCGESTPWRSSERNTQPFWESPSLEQWLSDKVPAEAVELALRTGAVATDSTPPYHAPIELFDEPHCRPNAWGISSRSIATGSFPAYQIEITLQCPDYTLSWSSTITSQLRVVRGWRGSLAADAATAPTTPIESSPAPEPPSGF